MFKKTWLTILILCLSISFLSANIIARQYFANFRLKAIKLIGGERDDSTVRNFEELQIGYYLSKNFALKINAGYGFVRVRDKSVLLELHSHLEEKTDSLQTTVIPLSLGLRYNLLNNKRWIPFLEMGLGAVNWELENNETKDKSSATNFSGNIGGGIEWAVSRNFGLDFSVNFNNYFGQDKDMSGLGDEQSGSITAGFGFTLRFGGLKDSDKDGLDDNVDRCPFQPEDFDGFEDKDGCPDRDNDGDMLPDSVETATGIFVDIDDTGTDPDNIDSDEDGINDYEEIYSFKTDPNKQDSDDDGLTDGDEVTVFKTDPNIYDTDQDSLSDGREINELETDPLNADTDGDGILDNLDACPNQAENINGFEDNDGCPDEKPAIEFKEKAPIVLKEVNFATGSAELTEAAEEKLKQVVETLKNYPEMQLEIGGHTDNTGSRAFNIDLSMRRARSVKRFLVNQGIQEYRLKAVGYGPDHPIASNRTEEGRAKNRRIEFFRIK